MGSLKRATIRDVARAAEVSAATVSIVLNGKGGAVPETTRERIRRAADALNYTPDYNARAMVTKKTRTVGVIIPDISNGFFAELVRGLQVELSKYGYDIILCNSEEKKENDLRYIRLLAGRNVDALVLTMSAESMEEGSRAQIGDTLAEVRVPYLFLDRYYPGAKPKVVVDNTMSSFTIANYLLDSGHTRIGAITGPMVLNSSYNRLKGLKKAVTERGLAWDDACVYEGRYDFESGVKGAAALYRQGVTALYAFSDMQAYGVYDWAKRAGVRIPDDISVAGFDDTFYSAVLETPLTTMRQPVRAMARETCRVVLEVMDGKTDSEVRLPAEIIVRDSVRRIN